MMKGVDYDTTDCGRHSDRNVDVRKSGSIIAILGDSLGFVNVGLPLPSEGCRITLQ